MYIFKSSEGGLDKSLKTNVIPKFSTEGLVRKMGKCLFMIIIGSNEGIHYIHTARVYTYVFPL